MSVKLIEKDAVPPSLRCLSCLDVRLEMLGPYLLTQWEEAAQDTCHNREAEIPSNPATYLNAAIPEAGFHVCELTYCPSGLH